jgi:hypothetical protein
VFASQAFVRGLLNVLLVVVAFRLLKIGDSGAGFLNASFGAGGLAGGLAGLGLVGVRRLAQPFAAGPRSPPPGAGPSSCLAARVLSLFRQRATARF